jgi:phage baseplate assembly protein W
VTEIIGSGLAFPLQVDRRGGIALARDETDIEQAIEFGCGVHDFVFDSIDASTVGKMENAIRDALDHWEPRVVVESVEFDLSGVDEGRLMIDIGYRVRVTNTMRNLVYPFYVIPAEEFE